MLNYLQKLLKEGLILSHDITKYHSNLTTSLDQLNIEYKINLIDRLEFELTIFKPTEDIIEVLNHKAYVLGYFPSYCWVELNNNLKNQFKWDSFKFIGNIKEIKIRYESKYDDGLHKNTNICPDKLYHLSYQENKKSILEKGVYPKSNKRLSSHPDRIYLFLDINEYKPLLKSLKLSDRLKGINKDYLLACINCSEIKLILHTDPNYRLGYFTYDNINPNDISIISENL